MPAELARMHKRNSPTWRSRARTILLGVAIVAGLGIVGPAAAAQSGDQPDMILPVDPARLDDLHWSDTWGAARSGGRSHIGVDMMGPKMVPLVAVADGQITWGRFNNARGSIIRLRADDGWEYQYIHLNNDTPGTDDGRASCHQVLSLRLCDHVEADGDIERGTRVTAGEVIGYLGDGGNAEWTGAHLHFEIYKPSGNGVVAVNPTPYVDAALQRFRSAAAAEPVPDTGATGPDGSGDGSSDADLLARATEIAATNPAAARIDRLYLAFFGRPPDEAGFAYWTNRHASGESLEDIAEHFARSPEFRQRSEGIDAGKLLDGLYLDLLDRAPDPGGKSFWLEQLEQGRLNRGTIVVEFTESAEMRNRHAARSELIVLTRMFGHSVPTGADIDQWKALRAEHDLQTAIQRWFLS